MGPAARRERTSTCSSVKSCNALSRYGHSAGHPAVATFTRIRAVLTEYVEASQL